MLDIQGKRINDVKKQLNEIKDIDFVISYNLGRNKYEKYKVRIKNKYEKYKVRIKELYSNIFTVSLLDTNTIKSFSYNDVITSLIHIDL